MWSLKICLASGLLRWRSAVIRVGWLPTTSQVDLDQACEVAAAGDCPHLFDYGVERVDFGVCHAVKGAVEGQQFEGSADRVELLDILAGQRRDDHPFVGHALQQTFLFQLANCLADRAAADA
jgi:hypothetical protein